MKIISFTQRMHGEKLYLTAFSVEGIGSSFSAFKDRGDAIEMSAIMAEAIAESITYDKAKYEMKIEDA